MYLLEEDERSLRVAAASHGLRSAADSTYGASEPVRGVAFEFLPSSRGPTAMHVRDKFWLRAVNDKVSSGFPSL